MLVHCVFLQETKTKEMCESMPKKSLKMDPDSEASQKVLAAVSTKFAATKAIRSRSPSLQPENIRWSENESRCSNSTSSWHAYARNPRI